MSRASEKSPRFEQAIEQLETIIDQIESGQCGLEDCITQYEKGMKLIARCQTILDNAQTRITELTADAADRLRIKGSEDEPADEEEADEDDEQLDAEIDENAEE